MESAPGYPAEIRHFDRSSAASSNFLYRRSRRPSEYDRVLAAPTADTDGVARLTERLRRPSSRLHLLQLIADREGQEFSVRRPEWSSCHAIGSGHHLRLDRVEVVYPDSWYVVTAPRNESHATTVR